MKIIRKPSRALRAYAKRRRQAGLTLIELLVVLVILTGIGGLLIPTITNALQRTHLATCSTNFPEVHQMFQRVQLEFGGFGTGFDSGIDDTGTSVNGYNTDALTPDEAAALAAVGITGVVDHGPARTDPTFDIDPQARPLADGEELITLTPTEAQGIFLPTGNGEKYVWLGIGRNWSLLGALAPEPPVHFGDTVGDLPKDKHSRFGGVFLVSDADGPRDRAIFKRVAIGLNGTDYETADAHLEVYWTEVNQGQ
ncbi:MAG TPA: prepilin-type N-terminal cleavage/methylation domain-containing protein [Bacteroidia bacterium]|nr:prepilin-type N-terminal cleavage/methylation domain-containing protein [Bacteroidia bacterium]